MAIDRRVILRALVVLVMATVVAAGLWELSAQASVGTVTQATAEVIDDPAVEPAPDVPETPRTVGPASARILQSLLNGLVFGLLLAMASVGLALIYGTTGLSNFAHGEQVSFGAVLTYFLATQQPVSLPFLPVSFTIGLDLPVAALVAVAIAAGTGYLQHKFLWSPLRRRGVGLVQQMIVSIGLSLAVLNFIQWWVGGRRLRLTTAIDERWQIGPVYLGQYTALSMVIVVACLLGVGYFLTYTRLGRATRAVSDNASLAAASGIRVDSIIKLVWIMSASLAAIGGILLALYENGTAFDSGARMLLLMFAAVTLGGLGHPFGALVGSIAIGLVTELSTVWLAPDLKYAVALGILMLVLLVRPQGILGRKERVG